MCSKLKRRSEANENAIELLIVIKILIKVIIQILRNCRFLNAETLAKGLNVSIPRGYGLMYEKGFPAIYIGSGFAVPKEKLRLCPKISI